MTPSTRSARNFPRSGRPKCRPFALWPRARAEHVRLPKPDMPGRVMAPCIASAIPADGSPVGRRHPDRRGMAVRAEMGRLPLPRLPRRRQGRAAIEVRPVADALFSGAGRRRCAASRPRHSCSTAKSSFRSIGAFSFDALLQRIHPAQSRVQKLAAETPALLIVFDLLAGADGKPLIERPLRERRPELEAFAHKWLRGVDAHPDVARDHEARRGQALAQARGRDARRHHGQAARPRISLRRPHRHAEDQELSQRRLRGRRLPLQRRQAGGRLAAARPL